MLVVEMRQDGVLAGLEHSSKGNQLKWEQDGWWYKADEFGYESLSEVVTSHLLFYSTITESTLYEPVVIRYKEKNYRGCRSKNFRGAREELIPLERLVRSYTGIGLAKQLARIVDVEERIRYTEELVRNITGREDFGEYLAKILEIDAFFFNEDRHTNNISLLYNLDTKEYRFCPIYDMGLSLFADTKDAFPMGMDYFACKKTIKAKPFSRDFDEQADAVTKLYGSYLHFDFSASRIADVIEELRQKYLLTEAQVEEGQVEGYTPQEFSRVEETLRYQAAKYRYMFS